MQLRTITRLSRKRWCTPNRPDRTRRRQDWCCSGIQKLIAAELWIIRDAVWASNRHHSHFGVVHRPPDSTPGRLQECESACPSAPGTGIARYVVPNAPLCTVSRKRAKSPFCEPCQTGLVPGGVGSRKPDLRLLLRQHVLPLATIA